MYSKFKKLCYLISVSAIALATNTYAQSDFYVQIHSGYTHGTYSGINQAYYDTAFGAGNSVFSKGRMAAGAGIGYNMDENLRFDLTITNLAKEKVTLTPAGQAVSTFANVKTNIGSYSANILMLNAYYDMKSSDQITPYLTAGLGLGMLSAIDIFYPDPSAPKGGTANFVFDQLVKSKTRMAFQLGFGFALSMTEQVNLDLGYRFTQVKNRVDQGYANFNNHAFLAALRLGL